MSILLKGFGFFVFVLCFSLVSVANEIPGNSLPQKNDTGIATTEMVLAAAISSPAKNTETKTVAKEEVKTAPELTVSVKSPAIKQDI